MLYQLILKETLLVVESRLHNKTRYNGWNIILKHISAGFVASIPM